MSIIPVITFKERFSSTSSAIRYFLVQAMTSIILIVTALILYKSRMLNNLMVNNEIIFATLSIKSGLPPFFIWMPEVTERIIINQVFLILRWQKIAPYSLISYSLSTITVLVAIIRSVVGAVGGYNQNSLKKVLTYSSMAHGAWIIMAIITKPSLWIIYFAMYTLMLYLIIIVMNKFIIEKISDIYRAKLTWRAKAACIFTIMSIGGLPPFLGFTAKFLVLKMTLGAYIYVMLILVIISLLSIKFYLKICFSSLIIRENQIFKPIKTSFTSLRVILLCTLNVILPLILYLM